ncbi:hypothetical protein [Lunatibacter salilacus]|uniref:hypothetical protein n=1 Tax=Lunatibacter salilacus TaxID=2483804 RepID=UPI00131E23A2|nr:hypothetical protein [Lunatibacter salilacus]
MGWTEFIKFLASGYLLYYGFLITMDLLKPEHDDLISGEEDLVEFPEETLEPINDVVESPAGYSPTPDQKPGEEEMESHTLLRENINESTGGISSMVDLFQLAQNETIDVKKQLVY